MASSLPFQLKTLVTVLKAGSIEYMLEPFDAKSLFNLATSDDPGLPYPPPLHLYNRDNHAIIGDSVKGAKPSVLLAGNGGGSGAQKPVSGVCNFLARFHMFHAISFTVQP